MEIITNYRYGGYIVPQEIQEILHVDEYDDALEIRTNEVFIKYVKDHPELTLRVVKIDEDITDYSINEYDGVESIIYVKNGKLYEKGYYLNDKPFDIAIGIKES